MLQVVIAIDDSKSMAENARGGMALEAVALISRALSRLEVGHLGLLSFGGGGGVMPLHSLDRPFSDADGARIMSHLTFHQVCALPASSSCCHLLSQTSSSMFHDLL